MPRPPSKTALLLPLPSSFCVFRVSVLFDFLHALWLDMMLANTLEIMLQSSIYLLGQLLNKCDNV